MPGEVETMDSPRLKMYKHEMARCFSRAIRDKFISYWNAQRLSAEIYDLLRHAQSEFLRENNWNDLFQFTIAVYRRWSHTEMDDDGGTILIMETLDSIWEQLLSLADATEKEKFFHFLTQFGSKESIYDLEQNLWDFLDSHFTEKEWLPKKKTYWEKLDAQIPQDANKNSYTSYKHEHIRGYLIQIKIDEGATIKEAEQLLQSLDSTDRTHRLARLYRVRNEIEKEQVLLEKSLKDPYESYYRNEYQERLLQLYQQNNELEKAKKMLKGMLLKDPEDLSAFRTYRSYFSPEEWETVLTKELFPALKNNKTALSLFAKENRFDLLMAACEACGELPSKWERKLQKQYPQRCLALLQKQVTNLAERAYNRKGYQWVARLLRRTAKYDGGALARQLISQFKQQYANRPAFMEELNWEFPRID